MRLPSMPISKGSFVTGWTEILGLNAHQVRACHAVYGLLPISWPEGVVEGAYFLSFLNCARNAHTVGRIAGQFEPNAAPRLRCFWKGFDRIFARDRIPVIEPIETNARDDGRIRLENGDDDAWICICGNMPAQDGFSTCDPNGTDMEANIGSSWNGTYRCDRCGRVIDQGSFKVIGRVPVGAD